MQKKKKKIIGANFQNPGCACAYDVRILQNGDIPVSNVNVYDSI